MGWKLGLAVLLLSAQCYAEEAVKGKQPEEKSNFNSTPSTFKAEEKSVTRLAAQQSEVKVTQTVGSALPPNPEIIVTLQSPEKLGIAEQSKLKSGSKFRNAAFGLPLAKVKESEVEIQNSDGANPRLPPFAFNGDVAGAQSKSIREGPDEDLLKTTPSYTTTAFEQARIMESLREVDQSGGVEQKAEWTATAIESSDVHPTLVPETVDTAIEISTVTPVGSTTADGEVLDPVAEYNKKVLELARRRKMLKEQGYKEYKKIMFKSGRNIVPVRLFFDTDPHVVEPPEDAFKRSISPITPTAEETSMSKESFEDLTKSDEKTGFGTQTRQELVGDSGSTKTITDITAPEQAQRELLLINQEHERIPEDVAGSGLPPPVNTAGTTETHEELLSGTGSNGKVHVADVVHSGGVPASVENIASASFPEDITRFEKMTEVKPAASSPSSIEQSSPSSAQSEKGETKEKSDEINGQISDDIALSESTTSALTTTTEVLIEDPTVTVPVPLETSIATDTTAANLSQTLPPLLSMPPLSALTSFSSLSTPVKVATRPRRPLKTSTERPVELIRKSSGVSGSLKKPRRKLTKDHKISVDVVSKQANNVVVTRPVSNSERQRLIKHKTSTIPAQATRPEFNTIRRITRPTRPGGVPHRAAIVGHNVGQAAVVKSTRPDREIYEHTFRFTHQRPFHARQHNNHPQFIRQGASPTDTRSAFTAPKELTARPAPSVVPPQLATVASVPAVPASPLLLNRPTTPNVFDRTPTFGPFHQQAPAVQLSLAQAQISPLSLSRGQQQLSVNAPLTRTLTPPVNIPGQSPSSLTPPIIVQGPLPPLSIVAPLQQNNKIPTEAKPRLSEWDRIREEFLRIKRQQRKLRQQQRQKLARAASGVKTLSGKKPPSSTKRSHRRRHAAPHNGEIARGVVWREAKVPKDSGALRVDVDRSRRTIDRDAIMTL